MTKLSDLSLELPNFDRVILESLRLAQRSITLRKVIRSDGVDLSIDGGMVSHVPQGCYIMTLLSITNMDLNVIRGTNCSPLDKFDPDRFISNPLVGFLFHSCNDWNVGFNIIR